MQAAVIRDAVLRAWSSGTARASRASENLSPGTDGGLPAAASRAGAFLTPDFRTLSHRAARVDRSAATRDALAARLAP
jgi:hypothetical protein